MENHKFFQNAGKSKNVPIGCKIKNIIMKDGKSKNVPKGWKIRKCS